MNENIAKVLYHKWTIPASVGVVSFAAGAAAGYIYAKRKPYLETEQREEQLELDFDAPAPLVSDSEHFYRSFAELKAERQVDVNPNHPSVVEEVEETPEPEVVNIFKNKDEDDWDMEAELASRTSDAPYIIHYEEFVNDEKGYAQITITYYEGDDILTDERDVPIYNKAQVTGELKFGHGSNDKNVCYVRNEQLHAEYEVLLVHGSYEEEVLGLVVESEFSKGDLKHSHHKFRDE